MSYDKIEVDNKEHYVETWNNYIVRLSSRKLWTDTKAGKKILMVLGNDSIVTLLAFAMLNRQKKLAVK